MAKTQDTYYHAGTYTYPNAVVNVYRPVLTDEEAKRRMDAVKKAAAELLASRVRQ